MSWGTALWDQYDNLSAHTSEGIDFLDKLGNFLHDRAVIETEYAAKLRRLVKNYQIKKEENELTSCQAFRNVLKEIGDLAGEREVVVESFQLQVVDSVTMLSKALREDRKRYLSECNNLQQNLNMQMAALERAKRHYEKSFRDSAKAMENFKKADMDFNLSRAEVKRFKNIMTTKTQQCDDAKNVYANHLQRTNSLQQHHYNVLLPAVLNRLQEQDEKRTRGIREFIISAAKVESAVAPIVALCMEGIVKASKIINEKDDSLKVVERYQSGFKPPTGIPFEDLSKHDTESLQDSHHSNIPSSHFTMIKGGMNVNKLNKHVAIFNIFGSIKNSLKEDFRNLPPSQRRKKLQAKISELQKKISLETATYDGLMKMKAVYEANLSLGNPMIIESQLNKSQQNLKKLENYLKKYQGYLDKVLVYNTSSQMNCKNFQNGHRTLEYRNSTTENDHKDDDNNPPDDVVKCSNNSNIKKIEHNNNDCCTSSAVPESLVSTASTTSSASTGSSLSTSLLSLQESSNENIIAKDACYGIELGTEIQPIGICTALYPFEATIEGSMPMNEDDKLQVVDFDHGDGWTRVRRKNDSNVWEEGFVPSSYIECISFA